MNAIELSSADIIVLHLVYDCAASIREDARLQIVHDSFKFCGSKDNICK